MITIGFVVDGEICIIFSTPFFTTIFTSIIVFGIISVTPTGLIGEIIKCHRKKKLIKYEDKNSLVMTKKVEKKDLKSNINSNNKIEKVMIMS